MAKSGKRGGKQLFSTDKLMHNVMHYLIRDFRSNLNDPNFLEDLDTALMYRDPRKIRDAQAAIQLFDIEDTYKFKCVYQLQSLNKRHRYQSDIYSDEELVEKSVLTFQDTQNRISAVDFDTVDSTSAAVLSVAKMYIARVLGVYDDDECRSLCRYGSGASIGVPARSACLAARLELPISGSPAQVAWFDSEMSHDALIQDLWEEQRNRYRMQELPVPDTYQVVSALKMTLVPKSYKSLRSIMADTTIGSFQSHGIGLMIRKRLKRKAGLNLKTLQKEHNRLASQASVNNSYVTADLSSASDSISVEMVRRLLPPDWFEMINQSRVPLVQLPNGDLVRTETFMTMGIGYTFELQTLIFWALLRAIEVLHFSRLDKRTISVYGDDLYYHSRMHDIVLSVFGQIGFVINVDKTFHDGPFRESCGGDFHRGVNVRPFQPKDGALLIAERGYEAILYKYINSILMRWSEYEVGRTLRFLAREVEGLTPIKLVPLDYPSDSGVGVQSLQKLPEFLENFATTKPTSVGHGLFRFSYLRLSPQEREELRHGPYYWAWLRGISDQRVDYAGRDLFADRRVSHETFLDFLEGFKVLPPSPLKFRLEKTNIRGKGKINTRSMPRAKSTYVTISHTGRYTRQVAFSLFESRS